MASRKIEDLDARLQPIARDFAARMAEKQIPFVFTCTYRSPEEQRALYAQGREPLDVVNALRKLCGLWPITEEENRRPVTWTLNSKHIERLAFDIAIVRDSRPTWDLKVDVDEDGEGDYLEAGMIGEALGLRWGGDWDKDGETADERRPDWPHYEYAAPELDAA